MKARWDFVEQRYLCISAKTMQKLYCRDDYFAGSSPQETFSRLFCVGARLSSVHQEGGMDPRQSRDRFSANNRGEPLRQVICDDP